MQNIKLYHLALEYRPGDFMPVDINVITGSKLPFLPTLQNIDMFTKNYNEEEIKQMIKDANVVPDIYLDGTLRVLNENKYRYPVLYKENNMLLDDFLRDFIDNKQVMNKFVNIYIKYSNGKDLETLKMAIREKNLQTILYLIYSLSYEDIRNIYFYILTNIVDYDKKSDLRSA